jgi:hypothetical protein
MGLTITSDIVTSNGTSVETYINISEYYVNKQGIAQFPVRTYFSKTNRDANPNQTVQTYAIANRYDFNLTVEELEATNIYAVAYGKIKSLLEEQGHAVTASDTIITAEVIVEEEEVVVEEVPVIDEQQITDETI